jgi:hypothetical protein
MQHEHGAAPRRQLANRPIDVDGEIECTLRVDTTIECRGILSNPAPVGAQALAAAIDDDTGEPGAQRRFPAKAVKPLGCAHPDVLDDILRIVAAVRQQAEREAVERGRMATIEGAKRGVVADAEKSRDKRSVVQIVSRAHESTPTCVDDVFEPSLLTLLIERPAAAVSIGRLDGVDGAIHVSVVA